MNTQDQILQLQQRMGESIIGQEQVIERLLLTLPPNGNLLLEGLPGLTKTRAVKTLARNLESELRRIQFTPDLLPSDVSGTEVYYDDGGRDSSHFQPGPIFGNLVLADEIYRALAKVQAALFEATEERQVTVTRKTHKLPELFMVLATQNPIEQEGTYPLPEAQRDRFLLHIMVRYRSDPAELVCLKFRTRGFSFLPRQPRHSIPAGCHASRLRGRGLNFEEIRRYLAGDDIRNMDWHVSTRTRQPHVRVYTEEHDRPVLLIIDQWQSMFFGSRRAMKSVVAAEAAALAAWPVLQAGDRVGACVFDDQDMVGIPPQRSEQQVMRILETVVEKIHALRVDPGCQANPAILNRVLERTTRVALHDYLVCLIGDAIGADAESVRHITLISAHNDALVAFIYDPLEAALPDAGRLVMAEGASQLEVDTSDRGLRERYRREFEQRLGRIQELSRQREIPVLPLNTEDPVETELRALLWARERGRR
jgi:uncharacterized protein (DUF58 family)